MNVAEGVVLPQRGLGVSVEPRSSSIDDEARVPLSVTSILVGGIHTTLVPVRRRRIVARCCTGACERERRAIESTESGDCVEPHRLEDLVVREKEFHEPVQAGDAGEYVVQKVPVKVEGAVLHTIEVRLVSKEASFYVASTVVATCSGSMSF